MERKEFIKASCSLCLLLTAGSLISTLSSCASLPIYKTDVKDNQVRVPVNLFAQNDLQIVRPKGLDYDIALRKEKDEGYTALLLRCTHADNPLVNTGNGFTCSLHGSVFDKEGQVKKGPAESALLNYPTKLIDNNIIIYIN